MSMTFTKLFSSITASTIWAAPDHTRLVWITMLAMADQHGRIFASIPGLAHIARVPIGKCQSALDELHAPDEFSRTTEFEGRRVEPIDGGWRLLNHGKYRAIRDAEAIKESKRKHINGKRAAERLSVEIVEQSRPPSKSVVRGRANTEAEADTEAYAEADAYAEANNPAPSVRSAAGRAKRSAPIGNETWASFSQAYSQRYGTEPVRNRKVNSQVAQLVERLGALEAPGVASYYLTHRNQLYVNAKHCVDLLLRDCEKLRTEWVTGNQGTQAQAVMADRTQTNFNAFAPLIERAEKERDAKS